MNSIFNLETIQQTYQHLQTFDNQLHQLLTEIQQYITFIEDGGLIINPNGSIQDQIISCENVLDKMMEIIERKKSINTNVNEVMKSMDTMKISLSKMKDKQNSENETNKYHDEIIHKLLNLETEKYNQRQKELQEKLLEKTSENKISQRNEEINDQQNENNDEQNQQLSRKRQQLKQMKQMKEMKEMNQLKQIPMITPNEKLYIEKWTKMKCGEIIFDSDIDNWTTNTLLNSRVMYKNNLIFIIEDEENQRFGGYVSKSIDKTHNGEGNGWLSEAPIEDDDSFVFSLNSNGRFSHPMTFPIQQGSKAFLLNNSNEIWLFLFGKGCDICIERKETKSQSFCENHVFKYGRHKDPLRGSRDNFSPKRFIVIQMK